MSGVFFCFRSANDLRCAPCCRSGVVSSVLDQDATTPNGSKNKFYGFTATPTFNGAIFAGGVDLRSSTKRDLKREFFQHIYLIEVDKEVKLFFVGI